MIIAVKLQTFCCHMCNCYIIYIDELLLCVFVCFSARHGVVYSIHSISSSAKS